MDSDAVLFDDVSISYGQVHAIKHVSVRLARGDYVCLVGGNGSGKTTFVKAMMGLIPLTSGTITLGVPKSDISYVPQIAQAERNFPATVWEVTLAGTQKPGSRLPLYTKENRAATARALETLEIADLARKRIGDLSGGQRQRVFLARAFARDPRMLVLDEPVSGLDAAIASKIYGLIDTLNRQMGVTVVMVSHDIEHVETHAKRVIEFDHSVIFDGSAHHWHETHAERTTNHVLL